MPPSFQRTLTPSGLQPTTAHTLRPPWTGSPAPGGKAARSTAMLGTRPRGTTILLPPKISSFPSIHMALLSAFWHAGWDIGIRAYQLPQCKSTYIRSDIILVLTGAFSRQRQHSSCSSSRTYVSRVAFPQDDIATALIVRSSCATKQDGLSIGIACLHCQIAFRPRLDSFRQLSRYAYAGRITAVSAAAVPGTTML